MLIIAVWISTSFSELKVITLNQLASCYSFVQCWLAISRSTANMEERVLSLENEDKIAPGKIPIDIVCSNTVLTVFSHIAKPDDF